MILSNWLQESLNRLFAINCFFGRTNAEKGNKYMITTLVTLHVILCILLTVVVLLQFGKGAEAGAMMGSGSSQAVFTSSAKGNFFTKSTTILAILFMANSIALTTLKAKASKESIFDGEAPKAMKISDEIPAAGGSKAPTEPAKTEKTEQK
jgi:preprotein translocase subunit SecG